MLKMFPVLRFMKYSLSSGFPQIWCLKLKAMILELKPGGQMYLLSADSGIPIQLDSMAQSKAFLRNQKLTT